MFTRSTFLLLVLFIASDVEAAELEARLFADASDGQFDDLSMLDAALIAGGARDQSELRPYQQQLRCLADEVRSIVDQANKGDEKAASLHRFLHRRVLKGEYDQFASHIQSTLDDGDYNCVSATLLYRYLASACDLEVRIIESPGHVYCQLVFDRPVDIQLTCPNWFESANREPLQGDAACQISPVQLVARIYYNRAVELLGQRKFAAAMTAIEASLRLDGESKIALANRHAALNNWALDLSARHDYENAAQLLDRLRLIAPQSEALAKNDLYIHQRWAIHLCETEQYPAAIEILENGFSRRPRAELFDLGRYAVYRAWVASLLEAGKTGDAFAVLDHARQRHRGAAEVLEIEAATINDHALRLLHEGRPQSSLEILEIGLRRQPDSALLSESRRLTKNLTPRDS